ncbi:MAG: type IV pilin protein [Pseudomonadota bacterium]
MANRHGFTMVELMMTVAIMAVLGAVAYPFYTGYIASGVRAQATSGLEDLRMLEEEYFSLNNAYVAGANTAALQLPAALPGFNPNTTEYDFYVTLGAGNTYTAGAIPQSGSRAESYGDAVVGAGGAVATVDQDNVRGGGCTFW